MGPEKRFVYVAPFHKRAVPPLHDSESNGARAVGQPYPLAGRRGSWKNRLFPFLDLVACPLVAGCNLLTRHNPFSGSA